MNDIAAHELHVAVFLLAGSAALFAYHRWRPHVRPTPLRVAALVMLLGAATFFATGILFCSSYRPARIQGVVNNFRSLPFLALLGYACYVVGKGQGAKSPILGAFCRSAPPVIGLTWLSLVVFGIVFPSTYVGDSPERMSHFWAYKLLNLVEFSYLMASATIFVREAIRRQEIPSLKLRLQHTSLFLGSCSAAAGVAAGAVAATIQAYSGGPISETPMPEFAMPVQVVSIGSMLVFYLTGLFIYHSNEENSLIHARLRKWIKHRHDLEVEFDSAGNRVGNLYTNRYFHKASEDEAISLSPSEKENAAYAVKLLGHLSRSHRSRATEINHLSRLHEELAATTDVASRLLVKVEGNVAYDIRHDSLYAATKPALMLAQEKTKLNLLGEEEWVQLAAVTAADAGYLPPEKSALILSPNRKAIKGKILEAYTFAKLTEEDL